jgi:hypothetical protein
MSHTTPAPPLPPAPTPAPARRPAPPATPAPPPARPAGQASSRKAFAIERGVSNTRGHFVAIYGPGGIGKTTLASMAPNPVFLDIEGGSSQLNVARIADIQMWDELLGALRDEALAEFQTIVVDSLTRCEQLAVAHTLLTVPKDKGERARSVEDYGYGKGYQHVYETFLTLMPELDRHLRAGRNVVLIAHDCTTSVPNPAGEDWIRWEPMLQNPSSGKASIRLMVRNAVDHLLFLGYDVSVNRDGKASGSGTRTLYPCELPTFMAKSRTLRDAMQFIEGDPSIWNLLLKGAS